MRKFFGFTLAEVLITLGIIGVVAAMTIPTLIANTRSQQYRSKFKKTISTLSQAARMSQAQYGFDYAGINRVCGANGGTEHPDTTMSVCAILNGTLTGAQYYSSAGDIPNYTVTPDLFLNVQSGGKIDTYQAYILSDGTIVAIHKQMGYVPCSLLIGHKIETELANGNGTSMCLGFIDVNGVSLPNKEIGCKTGSNSLSANNCIVKDITDIYPIRLYDSVVVPATAAAKYVLNTTK